LVEHEQVASALVAAERGIRYQQGLLLVGGADPHAHEIARHQHLIRIRQDGAHGKRPGRPIDGGRNVIQRAPIRISAPTSLFRRNLPLRWPRIQPWGFPRPRPNLPLGLPHSGGVLVCETSPPKSFRRSNGGDWTEGLTRNRLEHSRLRGRYVPGLIRSKGREPFTRALRPRTYSSKGR